MPVLISILITIKENIYMLRLTLLGSPWVSLSGVSALQYDNAYLGANFVRISIASRIFQ